MFNICHNILKYHGYAYTVYIIVKNKNILVVHNTVFLFRFDRVEFACFSSLIMWAILSSYILSTCCSSISFALSFKCGCQYNISYFFPFFTCCFIVIIHWLLVYVINHSHIGFITPSSLRTCNLNVAWRLHFYFAVNLCHLVGIASYEITNVWSDPV